MHHDNVDDDENDDAIDGDQSIKSHSKLNVSVSDARVSILPVTADPAGLTSKMTWSEQAHC